MAPSRPQQWEHGTGCDQWTWCSAFRKRNTTQVLNVMWACCDTSKCRLACASLASLAPIVENRVPFVTALISINQTEWIPEHWKWGWASLAISHDRGWGGGHSPLPSPTQPQTSTEQICAESSLIWYVKTQRDTHSRQQWGPTRHLFSFPYM